MAAPARPKGRHQAFKLQTRVVGAAAEVADDEPVAGAAVVADDDGVAYAGVDGIAATDMNSTPVWRLW